MDVAPNKTIHDCIEECTAVSPSLSGKMSIGVIYNYDCANCGFSKTERQRRHELIKKGLSKIEVDGRTLRYLTIRKERKRR